MCEVLFEDSTGCATVCEALGLTCHATWENIDDSCAPDTTRPPLTCEPESGHQSDYCVCRTPDSTCEPDCSGKACGDDGCGGPCGACEAGVPCVDNQCACVPKSCASELYHCGGGYDDGCGGTFSWTGLSARDAMPGRVCVADSRRHAPREIARRSLVPRVRGCTRSEVEVVTSAT